MSDQRLSTQPYKGTKDLFPKDFKVQKYIFETWRRVCESFGYEEYQTPLLENAQLYRAKSGEDVGNKELFTLTDMGGRELALRPELTPSVTRMVSRKYKELPKPIRLFSIGSFYRNEAPQRGRNREFWQLNIDIFGEESIYADIELLQVAIELMLAFNPPSGSFKLYLSNRKLLNALLDSLKIQNKIEVSRIMDKFEKMPSDTFQKTLADLGLDKNQISEVVSFLQGNVPETLKSCQGYTETLKILDFMKTLGYQEYVEFKPSLVRGFDYYDGMVFEVFDTNPQNTRSLFGGGRYNGLASLFGNEDFPATGFAPGDETTRLFLETWNLIPKSFPQKTKVYYLISASENPAQGFSALSMVGKRIRDEGNTTIFDFSEKANLSKSMTKAKVCKADFAILIGDTELKEGIYTIKDMQTGNQETKSF